MGMGVAWGFYKPKKFKCGNGGRFSYNYKERKHSLWMCVSYLAAVVTFPYMPATKLGEYQPGNISANT